jgi:cell division protein FtsZ
MGIGVGSGKTRAADAATNAISSPLLDFPISKAKGIVFNIVGGPDMTLTEINRYGTCPRVCGRSGSDDGVV